MLSSRDTDAGKMGLRCRLGRDRGRARETERGRESRRLHTRRPVVSALYNLAAVQGLASSYWALPTRVRSVSGWGAGEGAVSRIQNTRSQIPLCLQFLYTTEGNNGTTVIWLQYHGAPMNDEKHRRPCGTCKTLWLYRAFKAGFRYNGKKNTNVFTWTFSRKNKPTCAVLFFLQRKLGTAN